MFYIIYAICAIFICNGCEKYTVTDYNNNNEKHNIKQYTSTKELSVSENNNVKNNIINKYNNEKYNMNQYIFFKKLYTSEDNYIGYNNEYLNGNDDSTNKVKFDRNMMFEPNSASNINPKTKKYYVCNKNASHLPISKQGLSYKKNTYI